MKLADIYNKIGKQPLKDTQKTEAVVFVNGIEHLITKIKYDNGEFIGFETEILEEWFSEMIKPEKDKYVTVRDDNDKKYYYFTWEDGCWYEWCVQDDGTADGYPNRDIVILSWKYQD